MSLAKPVIIDVEHLCYTHQNDDLFRGFSFQIYEGDYVGIIGPNGGGKSTLVHLLLGLAKPSKGIIRVFGESATNRHHFKQMGYVPQRGGNIDPYFPATVFEVVASHYKSTFFSFGKNSSKRAVTDALQLMNITHLQNRSISRLSGGERQKVIIARALVNKPSLLILDEPVDGLDPESQEYFYQLLRSLNETGTTILFVTHDVHTIAKESRGALCLKHQLVCHGSKPCKISGIELQDLVHPSSIELRDHHDV